MSEKLNVYQRINNVMKEISYIKKTGSIGFGNNTYTAVLHDHVTQQVQPLFVKHGLVAIPNMENTNIERYLYATKKGDVTRYECQTTATLKVVNIDNPEDFIITSAVAHSFDTQDKSTGKAYSMAVKYCYLKLLMLASGDEEENRVEQEKIINSERDKLELELCNILKDKNKLDNKSIAYMKSLDINQLRQAIERNNGEKK